MFIQRWVVRPAATLVRLVMLNVLIGAVAGFVLTGPVVEAAEQFFRLDAWTDNTHYHPERHATHVSVAHDSPEGHKLNVACYLPDGGLQVYLDINTPVVIQRQLEGVYVTYRVNDGDDIRGVWGFNAVETLAFAPPDVRELLAQQLLWADSFYLRFKFEEAGASRVATFRLRYREPDHPMRSVLAACGVRVLPKPTPPEAYTIQAGDTIAGIAAQFNVTVDDLIDANGLLGTQGFFVGLELRIPDSRP